LIDLTEQDAVLDLREIERSVDLAPMIHRQRMVVEGTSDSPSRTATSSATCVSSAT
jgi:hypothetical protein